MKLRRSFRMSLRALFAHKVRAALALASVAVGVAAVVLTSAIGTGAQQEVVRKIETMGTNLLIVRPAQVERLASRKTIRGVVTTLVPEDAAAIAALPSVAHAAPGVDRTARVKAGPFTSMTKVLGTTPPFLRIRNFRVRDGRFFDEADEFHRVAVLGASTAEALFPDRGAVGSEIRIRGVPFEVIGVLDAKGVTPDGGDEDNQVIVPFRTAMRRVFNTTWLTTIYVTAWSAEAAPPLSDSRANGKAEALTPPSKSLDAARADIDALLLARHGREDFSVQSTTKFLSMQKQTADFLTLLATGLGAIALIVGGAGILALMLMSVRERTGEIGLRMAIGATPNDILAQFLFEATLLALGGWMAGLLVGLIGAAVVALGTEWTLAIPVNALLASIAMVLISGLGFGAFPARKASLLPPIEALVA
jgi:ABC-type antimicrobial peptide transport system permease subunit